MDKQQIVYEKATECLGTIFAFCLSRTSSREDAEDLSQEIVQEVLRSASLLWDEQAFYGWMWAIANNVYKGYLRSRKKTEHHAIDESLPDSQCKMPEAIAVQNEELNTLKRELSLLSEHHREVTIMYYIGSKSCAHISQELGISLEMVKYLLFKSRKVLKEGMNMKREFGEKSYNPGVFSVDVWMEEMDYMLYYNLFDRRLPGNILLAAYYSPMTVGELSIELGVSVPYLEDEIKILMKHDLIKQLHNARYQTNIVIFTQSCEEDVYAKTKAIYPEAAERLFEFVEKNEEKIRGIGFAGSDCPRNRLRWLAAHIALLEGMSRAGEELGGTERFPVLSNGTHGYIWGTNSTRESREYGFFNGLYGDCELVPDSDRINVCNFKIFESCQEFHPRDAKLDILIKAAKNELGDESSEILAELIRESYINNDGGKYSVNFPVFTENQHEALVKLLEPAIAVLKESIKQAVAESIKVVQNHAPAQLADICPEVSTIRYKVNTIGRIAEELCARGYLMVPAAPDKLGMYAVLK